MKELVSVIMSTYNEPLSMLKRSIHSILSQTYSNIQFIIINDNPAREELSKFLKQMAEKNARITYLKNEQNMGLVHSLNRGIAAADGEFIARMDADDIADKKRIELQLAYLLERKCDIVGTQVNKIDDEENIIGSIKVPTDHAHIVRFYKYGSCLLHPTWFGKKSVFIELNGYRNLYACEDFDFIMRAIERGFRLGNVPQALLNYRIRSTGISVSAEARQKLATYFIVKNRKRISQITDREFEAFFASEHYRKDLAKMNQYTQIKNQISEAKNPLLAVKLIANKYFYRNLWAKAKQKEREKYSVVM